jgi:hypothetical protein
LLDAVLVELEQRNHSGHLKIGIQRQPAVVENDPAAVKTGDDDAMARTAGKITHDDEPHVARADFSDCDVFGNDVILAVTLARSKRFDRSAPMVRHCALEEIARTGGGLDAQTDKAGQH